MNKEGEKVIGLHQLTVDLWSLHPNNSHIIINIIMNPHIRVTKATPNKGRKRWLLCI